MSNSQKIPRYWYNLKIDQGINLDPLKPQFDDSYMRSQSLLHESNQSYVEIPEPVMKLYEQYRTTPLKRAIYFEKIIDAKSKIYYKFEGQNASGSHKLNGAIPQAYYSKIDGFEEICTATGAGQWGTAVAYAAQKFGLKCTVFMTGSTYDRMPQRVALMEMLGAQVIRSPIKENSDEHTKNDPGSMALATSDAIQYAISNKRSRKISHVYGMAMHQTLIGLEAIKQMEEMGDFPDFIIGCKGGGTNFGGITLPFLKCKMESKKDITFIAVEPVENPTLTKGEYRYDYVDFNRLAPETKMYTLGHNHIPDPIYAGGLRYHGFDPLLSKLYNAGLIIARAYNQQDVIKAGKQFYQSEGILPAPESSYAICAAIEEALKNINQNKTILICISGHGHYDIQSYAEGLK